MSPNARCSSPPALSSPLPIGWRWAAGDPGARGGGRDGLGHRRRLRPLRTLHGQRRLHQSPGPPSFHGIPSLRSLGSAGGGAARESATFRVARFLGSWVQTPGAPNCLRSIQWFQHVSIVAVWAPAHGRKRFLGLKCPHSAQGTGSVEGEA